MLSKQGGRTGQSCFLLHPIQTQFDFPTPQLNQKQTSLFLQHVASCVSGLGKCLQKHLHPTRIQSDASWCSRYTRSVAACLGGTAIHLTNRERSQQAGCAPSSQWVVSVTQQSRRTHPEGLWLLWPICIQIGFHPEKKKSLRLSKRDCTCNWGFLKYTFSGCDFWIHHNLSGTRR